MFSQGLRSLVPAASQASRSSSHTLQGRGASRAFGSLTVEDLPKNVVDCAYAVRGAVLLKAEELQKRMEAGEDLPFKRFVPCNIGNPQAVGGAPLTFHRQVLACLADPPLIEKDLFCEDVKLRAVKYLDGIHDSRVGAYSHSKGHLVLRQEVAQWLSARDSCDTDPEDIYLTDGASGAVKMVLQMCVGGPNDGVLLPVPQYPLYSASMTLLGGQSVGYYLNEEKGWSIDTEELERAVGEFRKNGGTPRAIVVINPGNPTGQVMSKDNIQDVLKFAEKEKLMVLADEVYQDNIHTDQKKFVSIRQCAMEMGVKTEVFSFHSVSKGVTGECGLRGGLVHCMNVEQGVAEQMYKLASIGLCANVLGQGLMASTLVPPAEGSVSRAIWDKETTAVAEAYRRRAKRVTERLNMIDGFSCQPIEGAMYAFPSVNIKGYLMKKAISLATPADQVYCTEMVERTGIVTVPGSGFLQKPGTFHFRMTILPDDDTLEEVMDDIEKFHMQHAEGWMN